MAPGESYGRETGKGLLRVWPRRTARFYIVSGIVANMFLQLAKLMVSKELRLPLGHEEIAHFQFLDTGNAHLR